METKIAVADMMMIIMPTLAEIKKLPMNVRSSYNLVKSARGMEEALKAFEDTRMNILLASCKKDVNDKPVVIENQYQFDSDDVKDEANAKIKELVDTPVTINVWPIAFAEIESVKGLTTGQLDILLKYSLVLEPEMEPVK